MVKCKLRLPVVAGQFYPGTEKELRKEIESFADWKQAKKDAIACMLPHAGYMYSGKVAAHAVSGITVKENVVILGPNHTGNGPTFSIMADGQWQTPLGTVDIQNVLAHAILDKTELAESDIEAHLYEHSIEVEVPLLQYQKKDFKLVPIVVGQDELSAYQEVGKAIAQSIIDLGITSSTLIVASSDMTHYESQEEARKKDTLALDEVLRLDEEKLWHTVHRHNISMCGYAPAIVMIAAAKQLGATQATLAKYATSGDVTGDMASVVGYAAVTIS